MYLLSDKEVNKLFVLKVNDPEKNHGLISEKMDILLVVDARAAAEKKFGTIEALVAEKTKRAATSKTKWLARCEKAKEQGKPSPKEPDSVRKEREKNNPEHWNSVCANQSYGILTERIYGFYMNVHTFNSFQSTAGSAYTIVTDDSMETIMAKAAANANPGLPSSFITAWSHYTGVLKTETVQLNKGKSEGLQRQQPMRPLLLLPLLVYTRCFQSVVYTSTVCVNCLHVIHLYSLAPSTNPKMISTKLDVN